MELVGGRPRSAQTKSPRRRRVVPFADLTNFTAISSSDRQKRGTTGDSTSGREKRTSTSDLTHIATSNSEDSVTPTAQLPKSSRESTQPPQGAKKRNSNGKEPAHKENFLSILEADDRFLKYQRVASPFPSDTENRKYKGKALEEFQHATPKPPQSAKNRNQKVKPSAEVKSLVSTSVLFEKLQESEHRVVQLPWKMRKLNNVVKGSSDAETITVLGQSSCPPVNRVKYTWNKDSVNEVGLLQDEDRLDDVHITKEGMPHDEDCTLRHPKTKQNRKRRRHSEPGGNLELPLDFVEKQRAYFAEVDAFELPVEVVSSESDRESAISQS